MLRLTEREILANTWRRACHFRSVLSRLKNSDFPYEDSREAAVKLGKIFGDYCDSQFESLASHPHPAFTRAICLDINQNIRRLHPFAGFIFRSTNARNAFEIFDPLKRIANTLLGGRVELVLSSEWYYVPFAYPFSVTELPDAVFIGLPAVESSNALYLPLAGHELGHALWRRRRCKLQWRKQIDEELRKVAQKLLPVDINDNQTPKAEAQVKGQSEAVEETDDGVAQAGKLPVAIQEEKKRTEKLINLQAEELFSDYVGLLLFGPAYLRAFFYALVPGTGENRSLEYPSLAARTRYLIDAAESLKISAELPSELMLPRETLGAEALSWATVPDLVIENLSKPLFGYARSLVPDVLHYLDDSLTPNIAEEFDLKRPSNQARSLPEVVNAAWRVVDLRTDKHKDITEMGSLSWLDEVAFKTIEVIEYRTRTLAASEQKK